MNFNGAAQGFNQFQQADQQRQTAEVQRAQMLQALLQAKAQQQARDQALGAQQKWGSVLQGMMGAPQQAGVPPPPGTPQGGPQPPMPGTSSAPPPGPGPQMPPPGGPPASQGAIPPPPGAPAPGPVAPPAAAPMGPPPPFKPMPTSPPPAAPPAGGGVPPPPVTPPMAGPAAAGGPPGMGGQQFSLPQILQGLKTANVPPEQWGQMLDNLPEPVKAQAAQEVTMLKTQNDMLLKWADAQRKTEQGDRKLDISESAETRKGAEGQQRLQLAAQKLGIDQGKLQVMQTKLRDAEQNDQVQFDPQDTSYWTEVVKNGGNLPPGLARTVGGRKLIQSVMHGVATGTTPPSEMLANQAEFQGLKAGERTLGTRSANIDMAATEAASLADLALMASAKVPRTDIKTANDFIQMLEKGSTDPNLRAFVASNTSLINAYARAINPQGVGTVADKEHARDMLATAFPKGDYEASVNQLLQEIAAAKKSPGSVKGEMRERFVGGARMEAPKEAADILKSMQGTPDYDEAKKRFSSSYGYLPAGVR